MRTPLLLLGTVILLSTPLAFAGIGQIHDNGKLGVIDLTVDIRWDATDLEFEYLKHEFTKASEVLWDASEGQFRLGMVTFQKKAANTHIADIYVEAGQGPPHTNGVGVIGSQAHYIGLYYDEFFDEQRTWEQGLIIAHELGHYALGLYDEYRPQGFEPACVTDGPCFDGGGDGDEGVPVDHHNNCIMQPKGSYRHNGQRFAPSELCVAENHDLDRTCGPDLDNYRAGRETQQSKEEGQSCFETLAQNFPFVQLPAGLPDADPPPGFVPPSFIDHRDYPEAIMLVLDRSGSMSLSTEHDEYEVCDNGIDDDNDGVTDEADCTGARIDYMKAASRLFLDLAYESKHRVEVGLISYASSTNVDLPIAPLGTSHLSAMKGSVNALKPTGLTATGSALHAAHQDLVGKNALRSVVHFTDGYWNVGSDPVQVAAAMAQDDILVHSIGTGPAANADYLAQIADDTYGYPITEKDGDALPSAFTNTWARLFGRTAVIPKLPFHTNTRANAPEIPAEHRQEADAWFTGKTEVDQIPDGAERNTISFSLPDDAESMVVVLAGALSDMSQFGLGGQVISPNGDTCRIGVGSSQGCTVIQDPYYYLLLLDRPEGGDWELHLWSGSRGAEQKGYASVHYHAPNQGLYLDVERKVISTQDSAIVHISPTYVTTLYDLADLQVIVEDPLGGGQSFPVMERPGGSYYAEISGLNYRGLHRVSVLARTGLNTYNHPGESWIGAPPNSVSVGRFSIGAQISFATYDGWNAIETIDDGGR